MNNKEFMEKRASEMTVAELNKAIEIKRKRKEKKEGVHVQFVLEEDLAKFVRLIKTKYDFNTATQTYNKIIRLFLETKEGKNYLFIQKIGALYI